MKLSYKYRLDLSAKQVEILQKNFNFCRFLYNYALQEKISFYNKYKKSISYNSQSAYLLEIKQNFPEQIATIYSQSFQSILKRFDRAYQNFFRRIKQGEIPGFPKYKSIDRMKSICFPQSDLTNFGVKLLTTSLFREK